MILSIRLQKFRSYRDQSFEFEPGVNIIVGPNGSGKTNLLEAVLVLAQGGSYRVRDIDLVRTKAPWSRLDANFDNHSRSLKLEPTDATLSKTYLIDDKPHKRLKLDLTIPVVVFEPEHLQALVRGPEHRRAFIDDILERTDPEFKNLLQSYKRALAQRNALLKQPPERAKSQLFAWNIRLSELGSKVAEKRVNLIAQINKQINKIYSGIAHKKSSVKLIYQSSLPTDNYASKMLSKLEASAQKDFERGFTAYGPHRDDINFILNKSAIEVSASRGEIRSLVLALKIFELGLVARSRGSQPILLLDDVFSELDNSRRKALVEQLKGRQSIITTTDADVVVNHFTEATKIIPLIY